LRNHGEKLYLWLFLIYMKQTAPEIYGYFDYHDFLRDSYEYEHGKSPNFSYRYIKLKTGVDPGYLYKVFKGQKNISEKSVDSFCGLFKLNARQSSYFRTMVKYAKAKTARDISRYFEELLSYTEFQSQIVKADHFHYYAQWYNVVIRNLLNFFPCSGDFDQLAQKVYPPITTLQAKNSVALLLRLGMIEKTANDTYALTGKFLSTGEKWQSVAIRAFQKKMMDLASDALERVPAQQRDISTVTISLSDEGFKRVKERLGEFREDILKITQHDSNVRRVYNLNLQLIPVSSREND